MSIVLCCIFVYCKFIAGRMQLFTYNMGYESVSAVLVNFSIGILVRHGICQLKLKQNNTNVGIRQS